MHNDVQHNYSVVMQSVIMAIVIMLNVAKKPFVLSVVMLSVVMLSVFMLNGVATIFLIVMISICPNLALFEARAQFYQLL